MCTIKQAVGDLFSSSDEALAHCVSENLAMNRGIADLFRKRYGRVDELKAQNARVGQVATLAPLRQGEPHIFNLVTKRMHYDRPTYAALESSLVAMRRLIQEQGIATLSIPLLGCGLDRLAWSKVLAIIQRVFSGLGLVITVWALPN